MITPATGHITHTADTSVWLYDETTHWHKCIGCNEQMNVAEHHGGEASCTAQAVCTVCRQSYGTIKMHTDNDRDELCDECGQAIHVHDAAGNWRQNSEYHWKECACGMHLNKAAHNYGEWIIDREPAYKQNGLRHRSCTVCGRILTEQIIDALESPFVDVTKDAWYFEDVIYSYENNYLIGTSENPPKFSPEMDVSRAQLVTILWRLDGEADAQSAAFTDVADDIWYTESVNWASANGIVLGYGDGTFGPEDTITREQVMLILNRYADYKGWTTDAMIPDGVNFKYSTWAENSVLWAAANGMFDGIGIDVADLTATVNRAEIAAYLKLFCENIAE